MMISLRLAVFTLVGALMILTVGALDPAPARADSCWNHNGSVMRLKANGNQRFFYYENPRSGIQAVGVKPGTLLFDGVNSGDYYSGTARVFSKGCAPLEYAVKGPVTRPNGQIVITMTGKRKVWKNCNPTKQKAKDTLVFTYMGNC